MISVVMATYNSEKYILQQLDSILGQTFPVDEVVIVDDSSCDNTVEILREYIDLHSLSTWRIYTHECNQGYIKTFSEGLSYAEGDIIILCDHDDVWVNNKVELIHKTFSGHSKISALATSFCKIDENGNEIITKQKINRSNNNLIRRRLKNKLNQLCFEDVILYNVSPGCTCAITKELRNEYLKFSQCDSIPHDWKLMLIAACRDELYYLDEVTTLYRIYTGNTIGLGHVNNYEKRKKMVKQNVLEKKDMLCITKYYKTEFSYEFFYVERISKIFEKRYEEFKNKNLYGILSIVPTSLRYGKLYESIFFDIYTIIKNF